ncbi:MAG: recombination protein RecR [Candidatus Omnitrophica bacterium]|nr:recombination protein RecR [Candidatus Omnitrophota bacterium]
MKAYPEPLDQLIAALSKLPSIGRASAERIAFYLLKQRKEDVGHLSQLIGNFKAQIFYADHCHCLSDSKQCHICTSPSRDRGIICVVESPKDVISIEKTGSYFGTYHVLLGSLSALEGIGPGDLKIEDLLERIRKDKVREIILALNPNTEGETTALYLARILATLPVKVTRIAHGIPVGSMVEYTDQATLSRALEGRLPVKT